MNIADLTAAELVVGERTADELHDINASFEEAIEVIQEFIRLGAEAEPLGRTSQAAVSLLTNQSTRQLLASHLLLHAGLYDQINDVLRGWEECTLTLMYFGTKFRKEQDERDAEAYLQGKFKVKMSKMAKYTDAPSETTKIHGGLSRIIHASVLGSLGATTPHITDDHHVVVDYQLPPAFHEQLAVTYGVSVFRRALAQAAILGVVYPKTAKRSQIQETLRRLALQFERDFVPRASDAYDQFRARWGLKGRQGFSHLKIDAVRSNNQPS